MRLYRPSSSKNKTNKTKPRVKQHHSEEEDDNDDDDDDDEITWDHRSIQLPQPPLPSSSSWNDVTSDNHNYSYNHPELYQYMTGEAFQEMLQAGPSHLRHNTNIDDHSTTADTSCSLSTPAVSSFYYPGQNVWVCKSKGKKQPHQKYQSPNMEATMSDPNTRADDRTQNQHRYELFSRATIVRDESHENEKKRPDHENDDASDRRILVQYPLGSTYHVRSELLLPIFDTNYFIEQHQQQYRTHPVHGPHSNYIPATGVVVVYPETHLYRRACLIHTDPITDHFIEMGCAQGQTCHRVHTTGHPPNDIHKNQSHTNDYNNFSNNNDGDSHNTNSHQQTTRRTRIVLGIDKSTSCIKDAETRYGPFSTTIEPLHFVTYDIFQPSSSTIVPTPPRHSHHAESSSGTTTLDVMDRNTNECNDPVQEVIQCLMDGYHHYCSTVIPTNDKATVTCNNSNVTHPAEQQMRHIGVNNNNKYNTASEKDEPQVTNATPSSINSDSNTAMGLVIAIDINGNRHLEPILQCLQIIMMSRFTIAHDHHQPRLIIVKSRSLYLYLQQHQQDQNIQCTKEKT